MTTETELVSARLVAARACVLGLFAFRGRFEGIVASSEGDITDALQMIVGSMHWAEESGANAYCTATEAQLFAASPSSWMDPTLRGLARWHEESLGVLLWALNLTEARAYDVGFDGEALFRTLPFLSDSPFVASADMSPRDELEAMLSAVTLRDAADIEAERSRAQLWLWRARTTQMIDENQKTWAELEPIVRDTAEQAAQRGVIESEDGDFVAFGKPYAALSPNEVAVATSLATARLRALNWVCRHADDWDDVPLTT